MTDASNMLLVCRVMGERSCCTMEKFAGCGGEGKEGGSWGEEDR